MAALLRGQPLGKAFLDLGLQEPTEVIHVNLDKCDRIQALLASKVRTAVAASEGGEPLRCANKAYGKRARRSASSNTIFPKFSLNLSVNRLYGT